MQPREVVNLECGFFSVILEINFGACSGGLVKYAASAADAAEVLLLVDNRFGSVYFSVTERMQCCV